MGGGVLIGYLLIEIYARHNLLTKEVLSLVVKKSNAEFLTDLVGDRESAREIMFYIVLLLQALPGGLLLGAGMGVMLRRIRHPRLLCYGVLVWPLYLYLLFSIVEWQARQAGLRVVLLDSRTLGMWSAIYSVFYISMYLTYSITRRVGTAKKIEQDSAE